MTSSDRPAGYSGTPLAKKLGVVDGSTILGIELPTDYRQLLAPMPSGVAIVDRLAPEVSLVHLFVTERRTLAAHLSTLRSSLAPTTPVWVSWPKKSAKRPTTVTEDVIRELALPLGYVDVKVCAVSEVWSGLKLVVRKELR